MKSFDVMTLEGELDFRGYSKSTIKIYTEALEEFLDYVKKDGEKITIKDVKKYCDHLLDTFGANTANIKQCAVNFWFGKIKGGNLNLGAIQREKYKRVMLLETEIDLLIVGNESDRNREMWESVCKSGSTSAELAEKYGLSVRRVQMQLHEDLEKAGIQKKVSVFGLKASMAKILMDKDEKKEAAKLIGNGDVAKLEKYFRSIQVLAELL